MEIITRYYEMLKHKYETQQEVTMHLLQALAKQRKRAKKAEHRIQLLLDNYTSLAMRLKK